MSETLESQDTTTTPVIDRRPHRLYRALAWVGIAAGSMFIIATVFFSGYVIGSHSDDGRHHGRHAMLIPHPPMGPPPPMGPDQWKPPPPPDVPPRP